jgi:predicted nucleotidyltransferase
LFGDVPGGDNYQDLLPQSIELRLSDDVSIRVVDLDTLIRLKNAAGRPRDLEAVAELLRIKEERG